MSDIQLNPLADVEKQGVVRRKAKIGKLLSLLSKATAVGYCLGLSWYLVENDAYTMDSAIAIVIVAAFIAGSTLPIDISKIINNIKGAQ